MTDEKTSWRQLLEAALSEPGKIHEAFRAFHNYSTGNQILAMIQCSARGIAVGPISTYPGWKDKGRQVRRGEKALALWMPITGKKEVKAKDADGNESTETVGYTGFVLRNNWFVLSQTDGEPFIAEPLPDWNEAAALAALNVTMIDFTMADGNTWGYALNGRRLALNPLAPMPARTLFHELAHILLGYCEENPLTDAETTPRNLREVEAESVALLVAASLDVPGAEYSRGYIQNWAGSGLGRTAVNEIPEASIAKIFKAADAIIKAGFGKGEHAAN